ncbi:MAG: hypothetical protein BGO01_01010 [Armatimonadetes bacterium 55-13]|nr:MAG: hypothetical protein BGO01_01010 [Armatimonadetes bacterium 55-13]
MATEIRTPTDEQLAVIRADRERIMVTASAGAGKTFVLVERYLALVETYDLRPHQILTITFTKKAAAEMKRRIVDRLRAVGRGDEAQEAETGPIQTIHSFCERLLRENSLAAGLDPEFDIMSESEKARLQDECIRQTLAGPMTDYPEAQTLLRTLAGQRQFGSVSPYARLESAIARVLQELRGTETRLEDVEVLLSAEAVQLKWQEVILAEIDEDVRPLVEWDPTVAFATRLSAAYKAAGKKAPNFAKGKSTPADEALAAEQTAGLLQLAYDAWTALEQEMERRQSIDYSLLESRAVRLLDESKETVQRLASQYEVVMVDEAQDVNPMQYRLLNGLGVEQRLFVGDAQQSIYGFRQADVSLFRQQVEEVGPLRLSVNKRTDQGILSFVDDLFSNLWPKEYVRMRDPGPFDPHVIEFPDYSGVEVWEMPERNVGQTVEHIQALIEETGISPGTIAVLTRGARFANDIHQRLEMAGLASRIVGGSEKFYVRLEIRDLANTLKALGDPYDDFALLATLRSPVAGVSLDTIALLGKQSPVVEALAEFEPTVETDRAILSEFKAWFLRLKAYADRLSAWEVLSELFARSGYLASLARRKNGDKMLANVRKLLALAAKEPELGPVEFAEQIREIQRLAHREGDAPADDEDERTITIMTIHKSKGLEFDTVILPDMYTRLSGTAKDVAIHPKLGLVAVKFGKVGNIFHSWINEVKKRNDMEEELRVLYVAMTRAKHRLCIAAHPSPRVTSCLAKEVAKNIGLGTRTLPNVNVRKSGGESSD